MDEQLNREQVIRENYSQVSQDKTVVNCVKTVFMAMAHEQVVREQIEPRRQYVLKLIKAVDKETGEPITKEFNTYKMSDEQFSEYMEEMKHEYKTLGYNQDKYQKDDCCPLLVAEDLTRQAKQALVLSLEQYTGISFDDLFCKYGMYDQYIDINLRYLAQFVK